MAPAVPSPELATYTEAPRMSDTELVSSLLELLGARLVAYLCGTKDTQMVRQWADGTRSIPHAEDVERFRLACSAARLVTERDAAGVVQAWFQGLNPRLDEHVSATLLRDGQLVGVGPQVLAAACRFAAVA